MARQLAARILAPRGLAFAKASSSIATREEQYGVHIILGITITFALIALFPHPLHHSITINHEVLQCIAIRGSWLCLRLALRASLPRALH